MTKLVECVACTSRNVRVVEQWPTEKPAQAFACGDCGVLFLYPQTQRKSFQPSHTLVPQLSSQPAPDSPSVPSKKGASRALIVALDRHFPASQPAAGARVLYFGRGAGAWLNAFRDRGWSTCGIDQSTAAFGDHTRLTSIPSDPQFDLVIVYRILESLPRPLDALRELSRAIRPGGYCMISVPRLDMLAVHGDISYCLSERKNIVAFTEESLRGLLARAGLEVVEALHELDHAFSYGAPLRLRLVARKVEKPTVTTVSGGALEAVLQSLSALQISGKKAKATLSVTEPTECPACSGHDLQIVEPWRISGDRGRAVVCLECGLFFVHPQPSQAVLDEYYAREDGYRSWKANRLPGELSAWTNQDPTATLRTKVGTPVLFTAFDRFFPATKAVGGARVFDFGCGPGTWLNPFQDHGWDTCGLEPCTDAAFVRHKRLLAIPSEPQFDLVFLYHVLEHLPRPLDTIRKLAQALLPGGYCFVSVPRLDTLAVHRQVDYCLHPHHHIVGFTEACLRGLLARAGLQVVASFHELSSAFSKGLPTRLQLLARKTTTQIVPELNPASALKPVIDAFVSIKRDRRNLRPPVAHERLDRDR